MKVPKISDNEKAEYCEFKNPTALWEMENNYSIILCVRDTMNTCLIVLLLTEKITAR